MGWDFYMILRPFSVCLAQVGGDSELWCRLTQPLTPVDIGARKQL